METAGIKQRVISTIVDAIICVVPSLVAGSIALYALNKVRESNSAVFFVIVSWILQLLIGLYFIHFYSKSGQTPGMRVVDIKIVSALDSTTVPTWQQSLIRELPTFISSAGQLVGSIICFVLVFKSDSASGPLNTDNVQHYSEVISAVNNISAIAGLITIISSIMILFTNPKRSLTDFFARTQVIKLESPKP